LSIIDTMPAFYSGSATDGHSGAPQKPQDLVAWENWIAVWLICFCAIVWGGVYVLDTYAILPLRDNCQRPTNATGLMNGLMQIRTIVYFLLVMVTFTPLALAWMQRSKLNADFIKAEEAYDQEMNPQKYAVGSGATASAKETDDLKKAIEKLLPTEGGFTADNGTALFNASYRVAELVGYAGQRGYAQASPGHAPAAGSDTMAALT